MYVVFVGIFVCTRTVQCNVLCMHGCHPDPDRNIHTLILSHFSHTNVPLRVRYTLASKRPFSSAATATLNAFPTASARDRARLSPFFYLACAKRQFKSASCPDIIIHGLFGIHWFVVFYSIMYNENVICTGEA